MTNQPKNPKARFWLRIFILLLPINIIVAVYFIKDPLMVLHRYERFDRTNVMLNEAYVGWQNYLAHRDSIPYNSYIMGNSSTMAFTTTEWQKYLQPGDCAVRFFDNGESLGGVSQKLELLDSVGATIKHVLVIANVPLLKDAYPMLENEHLISPEAANMGKMEFQMRFLQRFLQPDFSIPYIKYLIKGRYQPSMKGVIAPCLPIREPYTNNFINPRDREIKRLGERYWVEHKAEFKPRKEAGVVKERSIYSLQLKLLQNIKRICDKHKATIKFVMSPEYCQTKTNPEDIRLMKSILGDSAVWDFTGINEYTSDIHNYYEAGHFRPTLGARILQQIYQTKQQ